MSTYVVPAVNFVSDDDWVGDLRNYVVLADNEIDALNKAKELAIEEEEANTNEPWDYFIWLDDTIREKYPEIDWTEEDEEGIIIGQPLKIH